MKQTDGRTLLSAILLAGLLAACSAPDQSPTVLLSTTQPAQDSRPLTLVATATSPANTPITKVEFFKGDTKLGEDTTSPYEQEVPINVDANTTLEFSAKATDQQNRSGKKTLSVPVTADTQAPTAELRGSANDFVTGGTLNLTATASDNIGVAKVEFYRGTTKLGEDTEAPYSLAVPITAALNGINPFSAKAFDFKGLNGTSNTWTVGVEIDGTPPTISLNISSNNLNAVGSILLSATASDNKGIAKVEFFKGTSKLGEDLTAPYTFEVAYNESYNQTDSFTTKALDLDGNSAVSVPASATIDIDITPPSINLSASSTNVTAPGSLVLTAAASDNRGITQVQFYKDGDLVSTVTTSPYTHTIPFTAPDNGAYDFKAKAFDAKGLTAEESEAVTVAILPTISSFVATPSTISSDGGAVSLNWAATNHSSFNLSVNDGFGLSGLPTGALDPSVFSHQLSVSANTTRFDQVYGFMLDANGYNVDGATQSLNLTQRPAFSNVSASAWGGCAFIAGQPHCWGLTLGAQDNANSLTPVLVRQGAIPSGVSLNRIVNGRASACGIASNNWAYCWGHNGYGQLGDNTDINRNAPVALQRGAIPSGATISKISMGALHACAIASNNAAYCWGNGPQGQLGNTATASLRTPVAVSQGEIPSGVTLTQISAAFHHTCALGSNGAAYCWGFNGQGQLGNDDGGGSDRHFPIAVSQGARPSGVTYTKLSSSIGHACTLGSNGWIYCWGVNIAYSLGDGTGTHRDVPVAVSGVNVPSGVTFTEVATGWGHTCALGTDSKVYCWGTGYAAGANSPPAIIEVPTALPTLSSKPEGFSISQLTTNWDHTCGLGTDKLVYCWGKNEYFSLGRESTGTEVPGAVLSPVE